MAELSHKNLSSDDCHGTDGKLTLVQVNIIAWCIQAITGANVNLDQCLSMALLGYSELNEDDDDLINLSHKSHNAPVQFINLEDTMCQKTIEALQFFLY